MSLKKIKKCIAKGELNVAIKLALEDYQYSSIQNELITLLGRLSRNNKENALGVLVPEDYRRVNNQIAVQLTKLLEQFGTNKVSNTGEPEFTENTNKNLKRLKSFFVGNILGSENSIRVESISWSGSHEFILTNCLEKDTGKVWHVESGKPVLTLNSKGLLTYVKFTYSDDILAIEGNEKVIVWKKQSSTNEFGVTWKKSYEVLQPEWLGNSWISQIIYPDRFLGEINVLINGSIYHIDAGKFYKQTAQDNPVILHFVENDKFKKYFLIQRIRIIKGEFALFKKNPKYSTALFKDEKFENSIDLNWGSVYSDRLHRNGLAVYYDLGPFGGVRIRDLKTMEILEDANESIKYNFMPIKLSQIERYRHSKGDLLIGLSGESGDKNFYGFHYYVTKDFKILDKHRITFSGHEKVIKELSLEGPGITTSSEDGTIRIWFPQVSLGRGIIFEENHTYRRYNYTIQEIGCIKNCHPIENVFSWAGGGTLSPSQINKLAYADMNGYVHIVQLIYNPFEKEERRKIKLAQKFRWAESFWKRSIWYSLIVVIVSIYIVLNFFQVENPLLMIILIVISGILFPILAYSLEYIAIKNFYQEFPKENLSKVLGEKLYNMRINS